MAKTKPATKKPARPTVEGTGRALLLAQASFNRAWMTHWAAIEPCDAVLGLEILSALRRQIDVFYFGYKRRENGIRDAMDELYRRVAVQSSPYNQNALDRFCKWYATLPARFAERLGPVFEYGGDSFNDLTDALALAGPDVINYVLNEKYGPKTEADLFRFVRKNLSKKWAVFILEGENYVESTLEEVARSRYLSGLLSDGPWSPREETLLETANLYDAD